MTSRIFMAHALGALPNDSNQTATAQRSSVPVSSSAAAPEPVASTWCPRYSVAGSLRSPGSAFAAVQRSINAVVLSELGRSAFASLNSTQAKALRIPICPGNAGSCGLTRPCRNT